MKKIIIAIFMASITMVLFGQSAQDFTTADCSGSTVRLYDQLDSGKVVVLCWVMPCGSCVIPARNAFSVVKGFQSTHPGRVLYYLCDDVADLSCSSLNSWANSNSIIASDYSLRFSDASIKMSDYGTSGMPKVVVLGGSDHKVYLNVNGSVSAIAVENAISNALSSISGIETVEGAFSDYLLFPNPVKDKINLSVNSNPALDVQVEVFNHLGQLLVERFNGFDSGNGLVQIAVDGFENGVYFVKVTDSKGSKSLKFVVLK